MRVLLALALAAAAAPALAESVTLDEALAAAARDSIDLRLARQGRAGAGVDAYVSYAPVLPRLDLNASWGRNFFGPATQVRTVPVFTGIDPNTGKPDFRYDQQSVYTPARDFPNYALGLQLSETFFDGLRSWYGIEKAQVGERAADRQVDETALSVAYNVTRLFYEVVKQEESLQVLEDTATRSEEFERRTEALFVAGRGQKSDVYAAQVNLGQDRMNVEQQRARVTQAKLALAVALGRDASESFDVVAPAGVDSAPISADVPDLDPLVARARDKRPMLRRLHELQTQAELDAGIAHADYFPSLGVQVGYNRAGPVLAGAEAVYGDPTRQYSASAAVVLSWNIFNGRQTLAAEQRAAIEAEQARLQALQGEQQVSSEIETARSNVVALARSAQLALQNLDAAQKGVQLAQDRLENGAATQLEVRDANLKLTQAKLSLLQNRIDLVVARADLARATGG